MARGEPANSQLAKAQVSTHLTPHTVCRETRGSGNVRFV